MVKQSITFCLKLFALTAAASLSFAEANFLSSNERQYLSEKSKILVCIDPMWMPYEGINEKGMHDGISSEYIALLSKRIGTPFVLHPTKSWKETLESAKNRSCDIISMARETEERKAFLNFTTPYVSFPYVIASLYQQDYISSLEGNLDKTYAVVEGYAVNHYLKDRYPKIKIISVKNIDEGIEKLRSQEAYGYLDSLLTLGYYVSQEGALDIRVTGQTDFSSSVSIATRNDEPLLHNIIQKALNNIAEQDKQQILERWVALNIQQEKKSMETNTQLVFNEQETSYIQKQPKITMCVDPGWMPYEAIQAHTHVGIGGDILKLVSQRSGLDLTLKNTATWKESLKAFKEGECDILSMVNKTPERNQFMSYTRPYFNGQVVFVAKNENPYITDPTDIDGKTLAVVDDYSITEFLERDFPNVNLVKVSNYDIGFKMVAKGEVDLTADYLISSGDRIQRLGLYGLKVAGNTPYKNLLRIGVQKEQTQLLYILDKTVASITEHQIKAITDKWRTVRYDHKVDTTIVWQIVLAASFIIAFSLFWSLRLHDARTKTQSALDELAKTQEKLEKLATTDKLTGIFNRAKLDESLESELQRSQRLNNTFGVLLIDLDHFKSVNDTHGHQVGDEVLIHVSDILTQETRQMDIVGRWGGEEFMVICPETDLEDTIKVAEKLRSKMESHQFPVVGKKTASFGATIFQTSDSKETLLARVDSKLYEAKKRGRNRIITS